MPQKQVKLRRKLTVLLALPLLCLCLRLLSPFVFGALLAAASIPLSRRFRSRLPKYADITALSVLVLAAAAALFLLQRLTAAGLSMLTALCPGWIDGVGTSLNGFLPAQTVSAFSRALDGVFRALGALLRFMQKQTNVPAVSACIIVVTACLLRPQLPALCTRFQLPAAFISRLRSLLKVLHTAVTSTWRLVLPRFGCSAVLSFAALSLCAVPYAWICALALAALEVSCGAGWLLVPGIFCTARLSALPAACSLFALYMMLLFTRMHFVSAHCEPSAKRALRILAAGYVGFHLLGSFGLLLFPPLAAAAAAFYRIYRRSAVTV